MSSESREMLCTNNSLHLRDRAILGEHAGCVPGIFDLSKDFICISELLLVGVEEKMLILTQRTGACTMTLSGMCIERRKTPTATEIRRNSDYAC
jgi:hypothetical protein